MKTVSGFKYKELYCQCDVSRYSIRFERGGYDFSSDLLKKDFRWSLGLLSCPFDPDGFMEHPWLWGPYLHTLSFCVIFNDLRILSAAVQLRSLDDASQGFIPFFVKDIWWLDWGVW